MNIYKIILALIVLMSYNKIYKKDWSFFKEYGDSRIYYTKTIITILIELGIFFIIYKA
jgi:hypothetical protein